MTSIPAIDTNHTKILTGLQDSRLCNKLVESKAKKWTTMFQVLHVVTDIAIDFKRSHGSHSQHSKSNTFHPQILVPLSGLTSHLKNVQQLLN